MLKNFSCDIKFYETLVDNLDIALKFKNKRDLTSLVMGQKCLNLLSPAHFFCHVRGCGKILVLGGFSKMHIIERHWHEHQAYSSDSLSSCADLALRYAFLKTAAGKLWLRMSGSLEEQIMKLEGMQYKGKPLTVIQGNFIYVMKDTKFEGRPLMVDDVILNSIINGDHNALSKLPRLVTMEVVLQSELYEKGQKF